jgi:uncharacterized protein DUF2784
MERQVASACAPTFLNLFWRGGQAKLGRFILRVVALSEEMAVYNSRQGSEMSGKLYLALADTVLILHLVFIAWVIFGALLTRGRPRLALVHVVTLLYGIIVEVTTLVCPLTFAENWCEAHAGVSPYHGPFVLHYLDAIVYPNLPGWLLIVSGVVVCIFNVGVYVRRFLLRKMLE